MMIFLPLLAVSVLAADFPIYRAGAGPFIPSSTMPTIRAAANSTGEAEPPLYYKPGAGIMTGPVNVYYIYYGDWSQRQKDIVTQFTNGLIVSPWWKTTLKYYQQLTPNAEKQFASANIRCGKSANDNYSLGKILKNGDIAAIVQAKLNDGSLPEDLSGIYYVLTAKDVIEGYSDTRSMCDNYCGYHYSFWSDRGNQLFSAFSPIASACPATECTPGLNSKISPNNDPGVDAMLSVVAHELTETVTDPGKKGIAAWIDVDGEENADKCAWQFGNSYKLSSGASSNERIGGLDVLIQENWDPESQKCTMGDSALIVDRSAWGRFVGWWRKTF